MRPGTYALTLLALALGFFPSACAQVGSNRAQGVSTGVASDSPSTEKPAAVDQTADQPSLPAGVVHMPVDPENHSKMTMEADAGVLCKDTEKGEVQVHLSGRLKDVDEPFRNERSVLRVVNSDGEVIDLPIDSEFHFEQTFLAHAPLSFKFSPIIVSSDHISVMYYGSPNSPSMRPCLTSGCPEITWDDHFVHFTTPISDNFLTECGAPKGEAVASLVCQETTQGRVQVRLSGQLKNVNEEKYPKGQVYLRVFNDNATTPEFYEIRVDDQYRFDTTFEAHSPIHFDFGVRVLAPGVDRLAPRSGQIPSMTACSVENCSLPEGVYRISMDLQGDLNSPAALAACPTPPSGTTTDGVYHLTPSSGGSSTGTYQIRR